MIFRWFINKFLAWSKKTQPSSAIITEHIPYMALDDYCRVEIVPVENDTHILKVFKEIEEHSDTNFDGFGYKEMYEIGALPESTVNEELRLDYLDKLLSDKGFIAASKINYDGQINDAGTYSIRAYGFPNFTIFIEGEEEFAKRIWLSITGIIIHVWQMDVLSKTLWQLGEEGQLLLVDWATSKLYDLRNADDVSAFLFQYWK